MSAPLRPVVHDSRPRDGVKFKSNQNQPQRTARENVPDTFFREARLLARARTPPSLQCQSGTMGKFNGFCV